MTGRARRATRPTPIEFRRQPGGCADFSLPASVLEHRSPPASPCALPRSRQSLGTRSESGGDADRTEGRGRGAQGTTGSSADARDPMTRPIKRATASNQRRRQPAARSWAIGRKPRTTPQEPQSGGSSFTTEPAGLGWTPVPWPERARTARLRPITAVRTSRREPSNSDGTATLAARVRGVIDANSGWVSVGIDHDTAAFAVNAIRGWWQETGKARYLPANYLVITADSGGSNSARGRLWKTDLSTTQSQS